MREELLNQFWEECQWKKGADHLAPGIPDRLMASLEAFESRQENHIRAMLIKPKALCLNYEDRGLGRFTQCTRPAWHSGKCTCHSPVYVPLCPSYQERKVRCTLRRGHDGACDCFEDK